MPSTPGGADRPMAPAPGLRPAFVDLHVHLGWAGVPGSGVKMSAARDLTLANILRECRDRKGIEIIGVIDATTTGALADLSALLAEGRVVERPGGGLVYEEAVTLIPGSEVEVAEPRSGRPVHLLSYLPGWAELRQFSAWQRTRVKNPRLSSQRHHHTTAGEVVRVTGSLGGIVIPAHIFTPHKAVLAAAPAIADVIAPDLWSHMPAVELGLSSDSELADALPELSHFAFVSNSDSHSLGKIGREYNLMHVAEPSFSELVAALSGKDGRCVAANYGLAPRLGKYHRTYCLHCDVRVPGDPPVLQCAVDPAHRVVLGVLDRIQEYARLQSGVPRRVQARPPYVHQIPLQFVPGLGRRGYERLLAAFGTEMAVLHGAAQTDLAAVVGPRLAQLIAAARTGSLQIESGAGGVYGRIVAEQPT